MNKRRTKSVRILSSKSGAQPATRKMLELARKEILQRMDSRFSQVDSRFSQVDAHFAKFDARFAQIDARFSKIDSRFDHLDSRFTRMEFLLEEQNANNRIVLEGLQALWQRQDRLESRFDIISKT